MIKYTIAVAAMVLIGSVANAQEIHRVKVN